MIFRDTLEEIGKNYDLCLEIEIEYDIELPEKRTWDYPGSPGGVYFCGVTVKEFSFTTDDGEVVTSCVRSERPDWFTWLDKTVGKMVEDDWDDYETRIAEEEYEKSEDY